MKKLIFLLFFVTITSFNVFSQIPKQLDYQGVLKDASGNLLTGDYALTFKIYNEATGGTPLWTEIQVIAVANGLFSAHLGSTTPVTTVPFDRIHFLGITIGTETELSPRTLLTPSPYSFMSMDIINNTVVKSLNGLKDNVNLVAGNNITITPSGNDLTISAGGSGGIIGGSGTTNYLPVFTNSNTLGNSVLFQDAIGNIQLGTDGSAGELKLSALDNQYEGGQIKLSGAGSYDDWLQDAYTNNMRFFTNSSNTNKFEISNIGSGKADLNVEGEIQTQQTGNANMVPIAYGTISSAGVKYSGSTDNFSVTHVGNGHYQVNISNGGFYFQDNIVTCSVYGYDLYFITYYDVGTTLGFKIWNSAGVAIDRPFNFVVYRK